MLPSGEGGQSLHMYAQQPPERGRLGLAQLRELRSHAMHWAVTLAQLHTL